MKPSDEIRSLRTELEDTNRRLVFLEAVVQRFMTGGSSTPPSTPSLPPPGGSFTFPWWESRDPEIPSYVNLPTTTCH